MDFLHATRSFERWLAARTPVVRPDLTYKHAAMAEDTFSFFRATYYRWAQQFPALPAVVSRAPRLLAVGDLHIENFGTWRDGLGRLAWGVNDFDEAFTLPYTHDLVRLATSAILAIEADHLRFGIKAACRAVVEGYREGLAAGGKPFIIGDEHRWFRPIFRSPQRDPGKFWDKLRALPKEKHALPAAARKALTALLPKPALSIDVRHRIAGLGNLGKPRYTALAHWLGGPVAREVKAVTESAAAWAAGISAAPAYAPILRNAIRSCDPFLKTFGTWVGRRLSPDCRRIELPALCEVEEGEWLLHAMGFETANIHVGNKTVTRHFRRQLDQQEKNWLRAAALHMRDLVAKDFKAWKSTS